MKPEKLKSPFSWEKRQIMIHDRVWYVPPQFHDYKSFTFPGWVHADLFSHSHPIKVEYCSGNGAWIASKAAMEPHFNWIAVEKKFERVKKIWSKIKKHKLDNLLIICGEAQAVTQNYFPSGTISEVFVNFPDPWPKQRHAKNRLIQNTFVQEMHRILQQQGKFTLVTDDADYSKIMIKVLHQCEGFKSEFGDPFFKNEWSQYGTSYFEDLWRQKGKEIRYHQYSKVL